MIRIVFFLVAVALAALGVAWIADRPGEISIVWHGLRIETSLMVALVALAAIVAVAIFVWSLLRGIVQSPQRLRHFLQQRHEKQSLSAIARGLIAVGAGDANAARKYATLARKLSPEAPLSLLLGAQTAQLTGDRDAAQSSFRAMTKQDETKLLGLHGLYIEARRRQDANAARLCAEEAARIAPALSWAGQAVLQFRCVGGDWQGALEALSQNYKSGALDKAVYRRHRAVLLTAQAMSETNRDNAIALSLDAVKLAPDLVPAAALAGRFLAESGEARKASRLLTKAWIANPHPDIAEAYASTRLGDSALERLARVETLAAKTPGNVEGALALTRAAIDAREFARARKTLSPYLSQPTQRIALMMAEIEELENADAGRAREWMSRAVHAARDPAWIADGLVSQRWMPFSPVSGRLDAFAWKAPMPEIASEARRPIAPPEPNAVIGANAPPIASAPIEAAKAERPARAEARSAPRARPDRGDRDRRAKAEPVIPLVHAPDDPGPETDLEPEPVPEASASTRRGLFSK